MHFSIRYSLLQQFPEQSPSVTRANFEKYPSPPPGIFPSCGPVRVGRGAGDIILIYFVRLPIPEALHPRRYTAGSTLPSPPSSFRLEKALQNKCPVHLSPLTSIFSWKDIFLCFYAKSHNLFFLKKKFWPNQGWGQRHEFVKYFTPRY